LSIVIIAKPLLLRVRQTKFISLLLLVELVVDGDVCVRLIVVDVNLDYVLSDPMCFTGGFSVTVFTIILMHTTVFGLK